MSKKHGHKGGGAKKAPEPPAKLTRKVYEHELAQLSDEYSQRLTKVERVLDYYVDQV